MLRRVDVVFYVLLHEELLDLLRVFHTGQESAVVGYEVAVAIRGRWFLDGVCFDVEHDECAFQEGDGFERCEDPVGESGVYLFAHGESPGAWYRASVPD